MTCYSIPFLHIPCNSPYHSPLSAVQCVHPTSENLFYTKNINLKRQKSGLSREHRVLKMNRLNYLVIYFSFVLSVSRVSEKMYCLGWPSNRTSFWKSMEVEKAMVFKISYFKQAFTIFTNTLKHDTRNRFHAFTSFSNCRNIYEILKL